MLVEPRLDLAFGLDVFLQLLERRETRVELMDLRAFGLHALLRGAAFAVETRQRFLRIGETRLRVVQNFFVLGKLHAQVFELRFVGRVETARFRLQALVTLLQLLQLLVGIALMRGFELQRLFGLRDPAALRVQLRLRVAPTRFERGHCVVLRGGFVFGERGFFFGDGQCFFSVFDVAAAPFRLATATARAARSARRSAPARGCAIRR